MESLQKVQEELKGKIEIIEQRQLPELQDKAQHLESDRKQTLTDMAFGETEALSEKLKSIDAELESIPRLRRDKADIIVILKDRLSDLEIKIKAASKGKEIKGYLEKEKQLKELSGKVNILVKSLQAHMEELEEFSSEYGSVHIEFVATRNDLISFMKKEGLSSLGGLSSERIEKCESLQDNKQTIRDVINIIIGFETAIRSSRKYLSSTY